MLTFAYAQMNEENSFAFLNVAKIENKCWSKCKGGIQKNNLFIKKKYLFLHV